MDFSNKLDKEILALAEPIMDNLITGSNELNYEKFSRDFSQLMLTETPEPEFKAQMKKLQPITGSIQSKRDFIGCVRRDTGVTIVWKGYFEKVEGEVLAQLSLDEEDNKIKVFGAFIT